MNTRNTQMEVAEFCAEQGLIDLKDGEEIVEATCEDNGDLIIMLKGRNVRYIVPLNVIRKAINVNAYWEEDPYNGGEKYLIVPQD